LPTSKRSHRFRDSRILMLLAPAAKANTEEVEVENDRGPMRVLPALQRCYTGTLGITPVRSTSATRTAKKSTVQVRFETQIGVVPVSACAEPIVSSFVLCLTTIFFPLLLLCH